jgi:hypothetical protein
MCWPDLDIVPFSKSKRMMVYLHGYLDSKIILKTEDYEAYYKQKGERLSLTIWDFLKSLFKNYTIIFVGVSFEDQYLLNMLCNVYTELKSDEDINVRNRGKTNNSVQHYAFMKDVINENIRRKLRT